MMALFKTNISYILICIAAGIFTYVSLDGLIDSAKYNNPTVPELKLPTEIVKFTPGTSTQFPVINVDTFLGSSEAEAKIVPLTKSKPKSNLRRLFVKAIMIHGKEKIANINGQMMKVGDFINGRTVLKIYKNSVVVTGPEGMKTLKIKN